MDSLLEALQSGAAFRDRRKRAPRPRGESHILYLYLYTNKDARIKPSTHMSEKTVDNVLSLVRCWSKLNASSGHLMLCLHTLSFSVTKYTCLLFEHMLACSSSTMPENLQPNNIATTVWCLDLSTRQYTPSFFPGSLKSKSTNWKIERTNTWDLYMFWIDCPLNFRGGWKLCP